ncbi:MAG: pyridoxal phosphate-dependent aminotransferase, partial [Spirochaetales bacterium]|nr:pyridoxal phosphate-dependent aminotransferase [Spirochaetales bacterium]
MRSLAKRAIAVPRSDIRVLLEMAQSKEDAVHLEIGQPCFPTPSHIIDAAGIAAVNGETRYTLNAGYISLREKFADYLVRTTGVTTNADNVVVTAGSMQALSAAHAALLDAGDSVLIPDPGYPNYSMMAGIFGLEPIYYELHPNNGFHLDVELLEKKGQPTTKVLIMNSPSNPTGAVFSEGEIRTAVDFAERHDLFILSDEAYDRMIFDGVHISPRCFDTSGRVVSCYSFSKTYSMAGWRIGFLVAPVEVTAVMTKMQEVFVACASSVSQKAAEAAIDGPQVVVSSMVDFYRGNRDTAARLLTKAGIHFIRPEGAFYIFIEMPEKE